MNKKNKKKMKWPYPKLGFFNLFNFKKMEKQKKTQRSIDEAVSKASRSLASRFVLASKMEIKRWKALVILVFVAGFAAALVWSAYNSWYVGSEAKKKEAPASFDTKNLVAYWSFDEDDNKTARDKSGNKNDGKMFDIEKTQGRSKKAFVFNGTSAYVKIPGSVQEQSGMFGEPYQNSTAKSLDITDKITLEAWIFPEEDKNGGAYLDGIITKGGLFDKNSSYALYFNPRSSRVAGVVRYGQEKKDYQIVGKKISMNKWSHVALTLSEKGDMGLYVNGTLVRSQKLPNGKKMQSSGLDLNIGSAYPNRYETRYFHGKIDEVRIYNRALSEDEIKRHAGIIPLKLKKLIALSNQIKNKNGRTVSVSFETLGDEGDKLLKDVAKSPIDGYAVRIVSYDGREAPTLDNISAGLKVAKEFQKKSGKEIWPTVSWGKYVPRPGKGCCFGDICSSAGEEAEDNGDETVEKASSKCNCDGKCEGSTAIDPWDEDAVSNLIKMHKTAVAASNELGVEGVFIDPEFYGDHNNYFVEYIQKNLEKKGVGKSPEEIEDRLEQIGELIGKMIKEDSKVKGKFIAWMAYADLGNYFAGKKTKHKKVTDCIIEGIIKGAKGKTKIIDGGEHLLRYIHPSLNTPVKKKNLKVSLEESIAKRDVVEKYVKKEKLNDSFELGGTFGLYQDVNKLGCDWGSKADTWCPGAKGKCDESKDIWKRSEDQKQLCPEVEVRTLSDHLPLLQRLFGQYKYVWIYGGDGIPPYREIGPGIKDADRDAYRSIILQARGICGNGRCDDKMGENETSCPDDCAKDNDSEGASDEL